MIERRVQVGGRGVYGRSVPLRAPKKRRGWRPPVVAAPARRGAVLLALTLVGGWLFVNWFRVTSVEVTAPAGRERVMAETQNLLKTTGFWTTVWTLDTVELARKLKEQDPLIRTAEVARVLPRGVKVTVTYNAPVMVWLSGNQPYLIDEDGMAIAAGTAGLPAVTDGSNLPVKVGDRVVAGRFVAFVTALLPELAKRGIGVRGIMVGETTLDVTATTDKGYRLVLDTSREVEEEMVDLDAVLRTLAAAKKNPAEYIDLRISGKAYWK